MERIWHIYKICLFNKRWTHYNGLVCPILYEFAFAVFIEAINNLLIFPQLFFRVLYCSSEIMLVLKNNSSQYSVS